MDNVDNFEDKPCLRDFCPHSFHKTVDKFPKKDPVDFYDKTARPRPVKNKMYKGLQTYQFSCGLSDHGNKILTLFIKSRIIIM